MLQREIGWGATILVQIASMGPGNEGSTWKSQGSRQSLCAQPVAVHQAVLGQWERIGAPQHATDQDGAGNVPRELSCGIGPCCEGPRQIGGGPVGLAEVAGDPRELDADLRATTSLALLATVHDVRDQLAGLVRDGFVAEAGAARLPHLVRYLRAARHRLAKAAENLHRDEALAWQLAEVVDAYDDAVAAAQAAPPDADRAERLARARWLIEELRVSLFAQQLGTPVPVSAKRIRALLA